MMWQWKQAFLVSLLFKNVRREGIGALIREGRLFDILAQEVGAAVLGGERLFEETWYVLLK